MKKWLFRILAVTLASFLTFLFLELVVRLFWSRLQGPVIPLSLKTHRISKNNKLQYELIPGSSSFEDEVWYHISSQGLRDREFTLDKPNGVFRIVALGDSFTFGMAVELEETWPKQLESRLNRDRRTEVINFGVMGYDTTQEAETLREKAMNFHPDLVVIGYCLNDIGILSRERRVLSQYRGYEHFLTTGIVFLDNNLKLSRLYLLVKNRLFLLKTKAHTKAPHYSKDGDRVLQLGYQGYIINAYHEPENRKRLKRALSGIKSITEGKIPVILAVYPELETFDPYPYHDAHKEIAMLADEEGFFFFDALPFFSGQDPRKIRISEANKHPNRLGNEIFSKALYEFILDKGLQAGRGEN